MDAKLREKKKPEVKQFTQTPTTDPVPHIDPKKFSGTMHTLVYRPHQGFADYAVATVEVEDGKVKSVTLSDPYCAIEARDRMDYQNRQLLEKLRRNYPAGYQHV